MSHNEEDDDTDAFFEQLKKENERKLEERIRNIKKEKRRVSKKKEKKKRYTPKQNSRKDTSIKFSSPLELLNLLQHDINCLSSEEKSKKFYSVRKVYKTLMPLNKEYKSYLFSHVYREILALFEDNTEFCRENGISLLQSFLADVEQDVENYNGCVHSSIVILAKRFTKSKKEGVFEESSEVIRDKLALFLHFLIKKIGVSSLKDYLNEIVGILQNAYSDYYKVKDTAFEITKLLCETFSEEKKFIEGVSPTLTKTLLKNFSDKRSNLRVGSIETFQCLVLAEGCQRTFFDFEPVLLNLARDNSHKVRCSLAKCMETLVERWIDKFVYSRTIVSLLLVLMCDESNENCGRAYRTLQEFGKILEHEKRKEIKETLEYKITEEVDYDGLSKSLSFPFDGKRPRLGSRMLVEENKTKILELVFKYSQDWNFQKRLIGAGVLSKLVVFCEEKIITNTQQILLNMFKVYDDDEASVVEALNSCLETIGRYIHMKNYVEVFREHLKSMYSDSPHFMSVTLNVLNSLISGVHDEKMKDECVPFMKSLLQIFQQRHIIYQENKNLCAGVMQCVRNVVDTMQNRIKEKDDDIALQVILVVLKLTSQEFGRKNFYLERSEVFSLIMEIYKFKEVGFDSLFFHRVSSALVTNISSWDSHSPDLYSFESFVINFVSSDKSTQSVCEIILNYLVKEETDDFVVSRLFTLFNHILGRNPKALLPQFNRIIENLVQPNLVWKVGKDRERIRFRAVNTMGILITSELLSQSQKKLLHESSFSNYVSCLDEYSKEIRRSCLGSISKYVLQFKDIFKKEDKDRLFNELVKLLNDVEDSIRISVLEAFPTYFENFNDVKKLHELLKKLMIHLDDRNFEVQNGVNECLQRLKTFDEDEKLKELSSIEMEEEKIFQSSKTKGLLKLLSELK